MRIGAVIAEYNPFHNGHQYQLERFRREWALDYVIVIMSGNFTQRGEPAWMSKHMRAKSALLGGADLVLELPVCYATGSAPLFAEGAVAHLNALNCIDFLCFGCESGEDEGAHLEKLEKAAKILADEPETFKKILAEYMKQGLSYPAAREKALSQFTDTQELSAPNNILALEYMVALIKTASSIQPVPLRRIGQDYHGTASGEKMPSATALRLLFTEGIPTSQISGISDETLGIVKEGWGRFLPVLTEDFSELFAAAFLRNKDELTVFSDMNREISNRMNRCFYHYKQLSPFLMEVNNRSLTYSRLCRCAAHMMLDIKTSFVTELQTEGWAFYGRILGFRQRALPLLSCLKASATVPLIEKMSRYKTLLSGTGLRLIEKDIYASDVYRTVCQMKFGKVLNNEFNQPIIII